MSSPKIDRKTANECSEGNAGNEGDVEVVKVIQKKSLITQSKIIKEVSESQSSGLAKSGEKSDNSNSKTKSKSKHSSKSLSKPPAE